MVVHKQSPARSGQSPPSSVFWTSRREKHIPFLPLLPCSWYWHPFFLSASVLGPKGWTYSWCHNWMQKESREKVGVSWWCQSSTCRLEYHLMKSQVRRRPLLCSLRAVVESMLMSNHWFVVKSRSAGYPLLHVHCLIWQHHRREASLEAWRTSTTQRIWARWIRAVAGSHSLWPPKTAVLIGLIPLPLSACSGPGQEDSHDVGILYSIPQCCPAPQLRVLKVGGPPNNSRCHYLHSSWDLWGIEIVCAKLNKLWCGWVCFFPLWAGD